MTGPEKAALIKNIRQHHLDVRSRKGMCNRLGNYLSPPKRAGLVSAGTRHSQNLPLIRRKPDEGIWKKPPSGLVGAAYSSVGGGDRELSFDWVKKPFSR